MSIKFWFAKVGSPPRKRAPNEEKLYKSAGNPQNCHFLRGGTQFYGQTVVMDIWAFLTIATSIYCCRASNQGLLNGGVSNGGFPDLDFSFLFCPFLSFLGFFRDFRDLSGDSPGISPVCPFPLSRPINSAYEERSRKGPRHNLDLSPKKWASKPRFGNPPV